ncbi:hypothetical protein P2318_34165 [Myxococcaceae bacterium GXIMD 01537]
MAHAEALLQKQLQTLDWPPVFGLSLAGWALELNILSAAFLETACVYLSLYYPELDGDIARCRDLLDLKSPAGDTQALAVLHAALARVTP